MAGEVAKGAFGGAVSGAASGAPFGLWGMAAGALLGGVSGGLGGSNAKRLENEYKKRESEVQTTDPAQMAFLSRLRNQERNFRAGTDASSGFAAQQARNVGATTQANLLRAGGPGVVNNLLRAQAGTNQAMAGIGANAAQGANQMMLAQGSLIGQIADRKFQRQRELRNQAMERAVSQGQNVQNLFAGSLAMLPGITAQLPKFGGGANAGMGAASQYNAGGMIGNQYVPGVTTGINYGGLPTSSAQPINYGLR